MRRAGPNPPAAAQDLQRTPGATVGPLCGSVVDRRGHMDGARSAGRAGAWPCHGGGGWAWAVVVDGGWGRRGRRVRDGWFIMVSWEL